MIKTMHIVSYTHPIFTGSRVYTQIIRGQMDRDMAVMTFQSMRPTMVVEGCEAVDATPLTTAQRRALKAARDFGNANAYALPSNPRGWSVYPGNVNRTAMYLALFGMGLLAKGEHGQFIITDAGLRSL